MLINRQSIKNVRFNVKTMKLDTILQKFTMHNQQPLFCFMLSLTVLRITSFRNHEIKIFEQYKSEHLKKTSKLNNQLEANKRKMEEAEREANQLEKNENVDEDKVCLIQKNKEFGGASSRMVCF